MRGKGGQTRLIRRIAICLLPIVSFVVDCLVVLVLISISPAAMPGWTSEQRPFKLAPPSASYRTRLA
jgi:hypothetical protein